MCCASSGPSREAGRASGGVKTSNAWTLPQPLSKKDLPSFIPSPDEGLQEVLQPAGGHVVLIAGIEAELGMTQRFPSLFGNLGQPGRERRVRHHIE